MEDVIQNKEDGGMKLNERQVQEAVRNLKNLLKERRSAEKVKATVTCPACKGRNELHLTKRMDRDCTTVYRNGYEECNRCGMEIKIGVTINAN